MLAELFTKIDKEGYQIHVHQIGNAAATYALDAVEKARKANGNNDTRHSFVHVQYLSKENMKRMAKLNMNAMIAPYWSVRDDYYYDIYVPYMDEYVRSTDTKATAKKGYNKMGSRIPFLITL